MISKNIQLFLMGFLLLAFRHSPAQTNVIITDWLDNKKAAVSVTLDDAFQNQFTIAQPVMDSYDIHGTFFIITNPGSSGSGANPVSWSQMQNAINKGHEIGSHTVHHPFLDKIMTKYGADSVDKEVKMSQDALRSHLVFPPNRNCITMAYPDGSGGAQNALSQQVRNIVHKYYIGARNAGTCPEGYDTYAYSADPNSFMDFYYQVESMAMTDTTTEALFNSTVNGAIDNSGWFLPMYHDINSSDIYSVTSGFFQNNMSFLNSKKNVLWIAPFVDVLIYHKEKRSAHASVLSTTSQQTIVSLTDTLSDVIYNAPLTLRISGFSSVDSVKQGNNKLSFSVIAGIIQFNAVPDAGNITIYKSSTQPPLACGPIQGKDVTCTGLQNYNVTQVNGITYTWSLSDGGTISGSGNSISVNWSAAGSHTLTVIPSNSNGNGPATTLAVTVSAGVPAQPGPISGQTFTSPGMTENYSITDAGFNYKWTLSGGGTGNCNGCSSSTESVHWTTPGTYILTCTPSNACGDGQAATLSVNVANTTGINDAGILSQVSIYPSPNEGSFTIESKTLSHYSIRIIGLMGQEVFHEEVDGTVNIRLDNLQSGIYYVQISTPAASAMEKVVIR